MKTNVKRQLIICIITIILLVITINQTYASQTMTDANQLINLIGGNSTNRLTNENASSIPEGYRNTNTNSNTNSNTNTNTNNTNTNKNTNRNSNNSSLPNTGLDSPSIVIVGICVVSAIYAYKKIRDYNI